MNFARRTSCNRCGREKTTEAKMMKAGGTEIGKTLAEKSRGLFSANDWQCKTYVLQIAVTTVKILPSPLVNTVNSY